MRGKAGKVLYKAGAFFTALCLAFLLPYSARAISVCDVTVKAAPLIKASSALDGMVRVYLSSLGSPTSLTLTIAGNYTLSNGTALTSGETLYVGFNSSTGTITMTPGTVSCDLSADGRSLLVHCLDAPDAEDTVRQMKERYEDRLKEIFP